MNPLIVLIDENRDRGQLAGIFLQYAPKFDYLHGRTVDEVSAAVQKRGVGENQGVAFMLLTPVPMTRPQFTELKRKADEVREIRQQLRGQGFELVLISELYYDSSIALANALEAPLTTYSEILVMSPESGQTVPAIAELAQDILESSAQENGIRHTYLKEG